jgi:hypothetical protein
MPNDLILRAASLAPTTYDPDTNTIEAVISTGADVQRAGYIERLPIANADLRGIAGAPVLDAHNQGSTRAVLGVIEKAWKAAGEIRARIKLSSRDDVAGIVRDIADGILRNLSIGYRVTRWADSTDSKGQRLRTALAWAIREASFVPIGADSGAVTRGHPMTKKTKGGAANPAPENVELENESANENTVAETRAAIRDIFREALKTDLTRAATEADAIIDADGTVEQAQSRAYEIMQERSNKAPRVRVINPGTSLEDTLQLRAEGFAARYLGVATKNERAREFAALTVEDQARDWLEASGIRTRGMSREALLTMAFQTRNGGQHTTSDFGLMLDIGLGSAVRNAYNVALSPAVGVFTQKVTANDFRKQNIHQLGELPMLQKVTESGEIKSVTRGEAREGWAVDTYGAMFSASRKLQVNDAYNQLGDFARDAGQAAAATVADLVIRELTQAGGLGPTMFDTKTMFHADHRNLITAAETAGIDEAGISAMRVAMLTQRGVDGVTIIDVRPDTIIVAPSRLTEAEKFVAAINPTATSEAQPIKLNVAVEPRLEDVNPWGFYLADSRNPALYLGGLAGSEGPQVSARDGWEILGREWRVTLDVGVGARDFRGVAYNAGEDSNT